MSQIVTTRRRIVTADDDLRRVARLLVDRAEWCGRLGSLLYEGLPECAADNALAGGPVLSVLEPHASDPSRSMLALRFMGAIHRIVLEGRAARWHGLSIDGRPSESGSLPCHRSSPL
jgi:hypothetical protein